jgi:protein-disulfide isomerase
MAKVKADIAAGNRIKVTGTPTVIVNDRRLPGVPLEFVPGILEKILLEESKR